MGVLLDELAVRQMGKANKERFGHSVRRHDIDRLIESHEELRERNGRQRITIEGLQRREDNRFDPGYWRGFLDAVRIIGSLPADESFDTKQQAAQRRLVAELDATAHSQY